jgi:hypothetical protein
MKPVALIAAILTGAAALTLIVPSLVGGAYVYAASVAALAGVGIALRFNIPQSDWSDVVWVAECAGTALAIFEGLHPIFALVAISLYIYAWNSGHRFAHFDRGHMERKARMQFVRDALIQALAAALGVSLLVTVFFYIHVPLPFGVALTMSLASFVALILFVRAARIARHDSDS